MFSSFGDFIMTLSPNRIKIDLSSLVYNLNQVKNLVAPGIKIMGIVKSDAYGHGILEISRVLESHGVDFLGVAHIQEALELRNGGIQAPIAILCGIRSGEDAREVVEKGLTPTVFDYKTMELLNREADRKRKRVNIHLKVDTGMGRLGLFHEDTVIFMQKIREYPGLRLEALMSHLSSADEQDKNFTRDQIQKFQHIIDAGRALGFDLSLNHLANSAGIMAHKESHFNMVRAGIMLYGGLPSTDFESPIPLKPVMSLEGEIMQIRELSDRTPVSYGRTYYTKGRKKIAVVSAGYGDGYPRCLSNRGKILIGGRRVNIVGTICMNMFMCDITGMEDVQPGDEVMLLGSQKDEAITGDNLAEWSDTISYEIFCSIGQVNSREYIR
jgi:alanine racemase